MIDDATLSSRARAFRDALEPVIGSVYFSPECHRAYARLGFDDSSRRAGSVELPDGPAYFTSRGSCLGQVPGEVVAAAFGVFNPAAVVPAVTLGWDHTDAATIAAARLDGAAAQLARVLDDVDPAGMTGVLRRAADPLRPEARPLFAGLTSLPDPSEPWAVLHRAGDLLREYRGDAHNAAWVGHGIDATEMGLMTELWWGLEPRSYVRTRAWTDDQLDDAEERLVDRGLLDESGFTEAGAQLRESIEAATDRQCRPLVEAIGDDLDEVISTLRAWSGRIVAAGGYPSSAGQLTETEET